MERTRYALVGTGSRSRMYTKALLDGRFADTAQLVGLCDLNPGRLDFQVSELSQAYDLSGVRGYSAAEFGTMIDERRPDVVIVTSMDRTHDRYIVEALERGCDVVTEKPLTTDETKCQRILDTQARTGRQLRVTFNYRYAPRNAALRETIASGVIGDPISMHFEWLLDTRHGADYFRRWHRDKRNSGGLMVHKASHHFDLANWWLGTTPATVFGFGALRFYGRDNAESRGEPPRAYRSHGSADLADDPWAIDLAGDPMLRGLYLDQEPHDGYLRDRDVFSDGISIEDDMAVLVRYASGATMSYHLTAYSPWEGYRVMVNGTKGRVELDVEERSYISAGGEVPGGDRTSLTVRPLWAAPYEVPVQQGQAGHGGADDRLLADVFARSQDTPADPLGRAATHLDGAYAMLVGAAANTSFASGRPVRIADLVTFPSGSKP